MGSLIMLFIVGGPPPPGVGILSLLEQAEWWRMRDPSADPGTRPAPAVPIRLEDMDHTHRLGLLGFLRDRAEHFKARADWRMAAGPGPSGDAACDAFDAACDEQWGTSAAEWLERQPLVRALVSWTTPHAESPLTWQPIGCEPEQTPLLVRFTADSDEEPTEAMWTRTYGWTCLDYVPLDTDPVEWRLPDDDKGRRFHHPAPEPGPEIRRVRGSDGSIYYRRDAGPMLGDQMSRRDPTVDTWFRIGIAGFGMGHETWKDLIQRVGTLVDTTPPPECEHEGYESQDCAACGSGFYPCEHGGTRDSDYCRGCEQS